MSARRTNLLPGTPEPWLLTADGTERHAVVCLHALGENRTGNNYWLSRLADDLDGFAVLRFDLAGCGESLEPHDWTVWVAQTQEAVGWAATRFDEVHVLARGASTALLPDDPRPSRRIALFPPEPEHVRRVAGTAVDGAVAVDGPPEGDVREAWEWLGAEPKLVGGLRLPVAVLDELADALPRARPTLVVTTGSAAATWPDTPVLPAGEDPLLREEIARAGVGLLLRRHLEGAWC